ncbi:FAD-dependent oxidoreductase [Actinomycetospora endophytica]|uniref:FAD-dependent oxidoreductase n=1 Tax=Actinomycetospora endophytica TaxID=2291215 RepID=A0ABS8PC08_9PSEU|nr:FAD-dependent oxidoreductase [Actinomycetospora endophytica]MCD2195810.1 FAD-dependent oxidoreductase [Actinomycetospora endophytica]
MTAGGPAGRRVVVVGGGLSGLAAAYRLRAAGAEVVLLERAAGVGGLARTERTGGYVVDTGADLINGSFTHYLGLAEEVGLDVVPAGPVADVLRQGRAITVDRRKPLSLARSPILSTRGKLTAARGLARLVPTLRRLDPYALTSQADDHGTAREFCDRYFDDEVTEWVVDPIVRAFAGTGVDGTSGLSVLAALAVGTRPAYAVTGGMAALPETLARSVDVRCGAEVTKIADGDDGVEVTYETASGSATLAADAGVLAISYHDARAMWPALDGVAGDFGEKLRDVPLMSISLGYAAPSPTDAYSVLVPTRESDDALLVMMQQNKSRDRAPAGHTLVTVFTEAGATARLMAGTDDEIADWAAGFVETYYPSLRGRRDLSSVSRWPRTGYLPFPGYWQGIKQVRSRLPAGPVHVTSALFGSGGVERAVLGGERTARRVVETWH